MIIEKYLRKFDKITWIIFIHIYRSILILVDNLRDRYLYFCVYITLFLVRNNFAERIFAFHGHNYDGIRTRVCYLNKKWQCLPRRNDRRGAASVTWDIRIQILVTPIYCIASVLDICFRKLCL